MQKYYIEYILISIIYILGILLSVAYLTVAERKTMGYMQRRLGPNAIGYYGTLTAVADALKLLIKEILLVHNGEIIYIISGPLITLFSVFLSWAIIPLYKGITIIDNEYSLIFLLGTGSIGVLGTVIVGWMSNSKYTILASIRTTAQLISYELILTTIVFIIIFFTHSLNIELIIDYQYYIWYIFPLFPLVIIYFIASLAETARPPFDNIEAESELVSGHMTELSASPFVIFFLSEYSSIALMSVLTSILFIGGYYPFTFFYHNTLLFNSLFSHYPLFFSFFESFYFSSFTIIKANFFMFTFVWVRASFPRLKFDLLIHFCWYILLPLLFALCLFIPSIIYTFNGINI
uniref:NADH-ubiquinone oxidoreductase chain 1 n=1 Tax=Ogataea polymorpha TaxID=460523 RepID=S5TMI1_9ASCO|nr:NADH dehydrogenase subunit 1 [Ogataea polymorpha]AGS44030.1 NADH dehydrogenase subunit 1 [Ogataea polymorpha]